MLSKWSRAVNADESDSRRRFYRAILCKARPTLSQDVYSSVCLSVTRQYYVEKVKLIPKLFSWSSCRAILIFPHETVGQYADGDPFMAASYEKDRDLRPIFRFISGMIHYTKELYLQWPTNRKLNMIYRTALFSMTLNDL